MTSDFQPSIHYLKLNHEALYFAKLYTIMNSILDIIMMASIVDKRLPNTITNENSLFTNDTLIRRFDKFWSLVIAKNVTFLTADDILC